MRRASGEAADPLPVCGPLKVRRSGIGSIIGCSVGLLGDPSLRVDLRTKKGIFSQRTKPPHLA